MVSRPCQPLPYKLRDTEARHDMRYQEAPPSPDIESEERLLQHMIHSDGAEAIKAVRGILTGAEFYYAFREAIFLAFVQRHDANLPIYDLEAEVYQDLARKFPKAGDRPMILYLDDLRESAESGSPENAIHFAKRVRENARVRGIWTDLAKINDDLGNDKEIAAQDVLDRLQETIRVYATAPETPTPRISAAEIPPFDLGKLIPPDGFLHEYVNYMLPLTEAPPQFHLFAGLTMLATVVQQRVYYEVANQRKYTNLWMVLTGPSGCKKSTSINSAMRILANSGFKDSIFPTQVTSERLIPMLSMRNTGTFFWSEWGASMDQWTKSYAQDTMSIFTALFDGEYFSRSLQSGTYEIPNSAISLFCGCTLAWLKKTIALYDVSMGFWPRFLFVPSPRREKYLAIPPTLDPAAREQIGNDLKSIQEKFPEKQPQQINFDQVEDIYSYWYEKINKAADEDAAHPYMASFVVRISDYVKKLAALVQISTSGTVEITPETMGYVLSLANWLKDAVISVISEVGRDEVSEVEERIYATISEAGSPGIAHRDLRHKFSRNTKIQIETAIASLEDSEAIRVVQIKSHKKRGRPGKKYIATGIC